MGISALGPCGVWGVGAVWPLGPCGVWALRPCEHWGCVGISAVWALCGHWGFGPCELWDCVDTGAVLTVWTLGLC